MTHPLRLGRRSVLTAMMLPTVAATPWLREEVVVSCDPELAPVLAAMGTGFGGPVRVFSAPPIQTVRLLAHGIQTDLLITRIAAAQDAARLGLLRAGALDPLWRNRLCVAALAGTTASPRFDRDALLDQLDQGRFAVTDPSPACALDGHAVLDRLSLAGPLDGRIIAAADTADVADQLQTGAARLGLLYTTEPRPHGLLDAMPVPDEAFDPVVYAAALTKSAWSRHQDAFLTYLRTPAARDFAHAAGLEPL